MDVNKARDAPLFFVANSDKAEKRRDTVGLEPEIGDNFDRCYLS